MRSVYLFLASALCLLAQQQWTWRQHGVIPVQLPQIERIRPAVQLHIVRTSPDRYEPGRIAIKLRSSAPPHIEPMAYQVLQQFGLRQIEPLEGRTPHPRALSTSGIERIVIAHFDSGFDPFDVAAALMELPTVEYATPLYIRQLALQPNDPRFLQQQALQLVGMPAAWDITEGSSSVTIAIIDSGTDFEHEDLAANLWTNPGETGTDTQGRNKRTNGIDDDGNGKIDDWRGWDFIGNVTRAEFLTGTVREDNDPKIRNTSINDAMAHGTNTAGVALAVTNNGRGIASPAGLRCRLIPIKCGSDDPSLANAVLRGYDAILYAARLGANVINCSWGGAETSPLEQDIIDQARALGALIVAASGNDGIDIDAQPFYPAAYYGVLTVGASTASDRAASFSNYGTVVSLYAPGENIWATQPNNGYTVVSGTSFAAPLASGVAALVRSLHPDWSPDQVLAQLRYSSDRLVGVSEVQRPRYYGRLNAYRAVEANRSFTSGTRFPAVRLLSVRVGGSTTLTTTAQVPLELTLENLLAPATNVQLQLSVSSNAQLGTTTLATTQLGTLQQRTLTTTLQLTDPVYFSDGTIELSCTITADGITDYARVRIPIGLSTQNTYTRFATALPHTFVAVGVRGLSGVWAVGRTPSGRGFIYRSSGNISDSTTLGSVPTTIAVVSPTVVCIGTANARIWRTSDGGSSWRWVDASSFTPSPQAIVFFDATRGICIGNPSSNGWRLGRSSDGGNTWQAAEQLPLALSGETTSHHAITQLGDTVWVGTSRGRILRSTNRGTSWSAYQIGVQLPIISLTFATGELGYCAIQNTGGSIIIYRTDDGGISWRAVGSPLSAPLPRVLSAPTRTGQLYAVCAESQVLRSTDGGTTWQPVLTGNGGSVTAAYGITSSQAVSLYMAGQTIAQLRIPLNSDQPRIQLTPTDTLRLGSVVIGTSQTAQLQITNTGTAPLQIDSAWITSLNAQQGEFTVQGSLPLTIAAGTSTNLLVRFEPQQTGPRSARLFLRTNASPAQQSVVLIGRGESSSSVGIARNKLRAYHCADRLCIEGSSETVTVTLWSLAGSQVLQQSIQLDGKRWELDLAQLAAGAYLCCVRSSTNEYFCTMLIIAP